MLQRTFLIAAEVLYTQILFCLYDKDGRTGAENDLVFFLIRHYPLLKFKKTSFTLLFI